LLVWRLARLSIRAFIVSLATLKHSLLLKCLRPTVVRQQANRCNTARTPQHFREGTMSQKNGHKARFGRQQAAKILLRKHMRELRKVLMAKSPGPAIEAMK
jgi:hypothetical protein